MPLLTLCTTGKLLLLCTGVAMAAQICLMNDGLTWGASPAIQDPKPAKDLRRSR